MNCLACNHELRLGQNYCSNCGTKRAEVSPSQGESSAQAGTRPTTKRDNSGTKFVFGVLAVLVLLLAGASLAGGNRSVSSTTSTTQQTAKSPTSTSTPKATQTQDKEWWPAGFKKLNYYTAYKPLADMDCGYSSAHGCYQIYVVTNQDCNLFLDVNFEVDGVVVDSHLDSATVKAGQQAIMTFASFETPKYSGKKMVRITDVTCY